MPTEPAVPAELAEDGTVEQAMLEADPTDPAVLAVLPPPATAARASSESCWFGSGGRTTWCVSALSATIRTSTSGGG